MVKVSAAADRAPHPTHRPFPPSAAYSNLSRQSPQLTRISRCMCKHLDGDSADTAACVYTHILHILHTTVKAGKRERCYCCLFTLHSEALCSHGPQFACLFQPADLWHLPDCGTSLRFIRLIAQEPAETDTAATCSHRKRVLTAGGQATRRRVQHRTAP